jgi:CheY-like chemotaxis protein
MLRSVNMPETKKKVLLVEDHDDCRELLALYINRLGYHVLEAATAVEAMERVTTAHPDLVIMDLSLPGMSGHDATALLKANPSTRDIPVVINTAHMSASHTDRALAAGAAEVLHKPVDLLALREVLYRYLSTGDRIATHSN